MNEYILSIVKNVIHSSGNNINTIHDNIFIELIFGKSILLVIHESSFCLMCFIATILFQTKHCERLSF